MEAKVELNLQQPLFELFSFSMIKVWLGNLDTSSVSFVKTITSVPGSLTWGYYASLI